MLIDRLVADGGLDEQYVEEILDVAGQAGLTIPEVIIRLGLADELDVLAYLAVIHDTHFVSTRSLASAWVDPAVIAAFPRRRADEVIAFPVSYDADNDTLVIVTADPTVHGLREEFSRLTGATRIKVYIAREAAIRAALDKHYAGNEGPLAALSSPKSTKLPQVQTDTPPEEAPRTDSPEWEVLEETVKLIVASFEHAEPHRQGHSARVARLCDALGTAMHLPADDVCSLRIAAHLHDVGTTGSKHVSLLSLGTREAHGSLTPRLPASVRLFRGLELPKLTLQTLTHRYERFDGKGFPDQLARHQIPLGARILAVADAYVYLTAENGAGMQREDAIRALEQHRGTLFDPLTVDWLRLQEVTRLGAEGAHDWCTLLIEPSPEHAALTSLRLIEAGSRVIVCRRAKDAYRQLECEAVDVIVTEIDLPDADGTVLLQQLARSPYSKTPLIFLTERDDPDVIKRCFQLGAADFLVKPASMHVLVGKVESLAQKHTETPTLTFGLSGRLADTSLVEVIQVLAMGKRTGRLMVRVDGHKGELLLCKGSIYDASFGHYRGAQAVYAALPCRRGDFWLEAAKGPLEDRIGIATDTLLLEAMRLEDERGNS